MNLILKQALSLLFLLIAVEFVTAQDTSRVTTDRPDQTDGVNVLKKGQLQFETELYYNTFDEGRAAIISSTLLRYGLLKSIEVRLLMEEGRERDKFIDETTQGIYPLALSTKIALLKDQTILPDIALITYLKMPLTRRTSDDVYWSPAFVLGLEKEAGKFTIASNVGIKQAAFNKSWNWLATADVKYDLTKNIQVYTEYFAQYDDNDNPMHNLNAGVLYYLNNNWMVHVAYGSTIFTQQGNRFTNVGFSFRIK